MNRRACASVQNIKHEYVPYFSLYIYKYCVKYTKTVTVMYDNAAAMGPQDVNMLELFVHN